MVTENINIDVRPGGIPIVIHVTQYEVGLRQFIFTPYTSNGTQTVVAGSATLEGTKPDGYAFQQACEMVDGVITYTLQEQLCAVEGRVWSRLVIRDTDGGMIGYTAIVWVVGRAGVADDAVMSDSDISALRQFLDEFGTIDAYRGALNGALAAVGGPLVAATASAMTDTTKVYVYTGSESGYTEGHWYYWNGSAWTDGGVYQATGINTDKTLTVEDMAADAKVTGDAVTELKNDLIATGLSDNSIPYDYYSGDDFTNNGIRFVKNADCSVSSSGTATGQARYYWISSIGFEIPAGTYIIGGIPSDAGNRSFGLQYAVGDGDFVAADYTTIYTDTEITIPAGKKISVRTWYYNGYEDTGHTWRVYIGRNIDNLNSKYNANYFVPIIYQNQESATLIESTNTRLEALETLEYSEPLATDFELGSFTSGGRPIDAINTVRTVGYLAKPDSPIPVKVKNGYRAYVHYYDTNSSIANSGTSGWIYPDTEYAIVTTYNFYRYVVQTDPISEIPAADIDTVGGAFYHDVSTEIVSSVLGLQEDVSGLNTRVQNLEDGAIADYWQTYLDSISDNINDALYALGNHGDSFLFFTDYHYDKNADSLTGGEQLYKVLEYIRVRHAVCKIINGGDLLQTHATTVDALEELNIFYQHFHRFGRMYNVIGNHDSNHYQADARLTDNQMYQDLFAGFEIENKSNLNPGMYYYFDNSTQKIRYIVLNTKGNYATFSADSAQHQWLIDTLGDTPAGYCIVVIPHWFFEVNEQDTTVTQLSSFGILIKSLLDAYNGHTSGTWSGLSYDFSNAGGKVIAVITGHVHREYSEISAAGYPMIGFICDAVNGSAQLAPRSLGTYTEHSVSLITIDTTAKSIVCTPIGAGTTRTFSYS